MKTRIVLVDDDRNTLSAIGRMLKGEGYEVKLTNNPEAALRYIQNYSVAVLVTDEKMPMMKGTELLAKVKQDSPQTKRIVLTGNASVNACLEAINHIGVFRFLEKPCQPEVLKAAIREALAELPEQSEDLELLEKDHPGIGVVAKDSSGAIIIKE